jgi:glutathione synthase/RimK-type ligase-like ATP-grasp enzyme
VGAASIVGLNCTPLVLEVNASPGFETIEQAHGCDCAVAILEACAWLSDSRMHGQPTQ